MLFYFSLGDELILLEDLGTFPKISDFKIRSRNMFGIM